MTPKISLITLGVTDLQKSLAFYRDGLGLPVHEQPSPDVVFFKLQGTWLGLYPKHKLAQDAQVSNNGSSFAGITIAHNVKSEKEVDTVIQQAVQAGATLQKQPQKVFWGGYSGYFADPDGYLWEVAYNPFIDLT